MNTRLTYQYRDAANFKEEHAVILCGRVKLEELAIYLHEGEFFVPSEVGWPDLQSSPFAEYDHIWHELVTVEPTEQEPTADLGTTELVQRFSAAARTDWNQRDVFIRKGLLCPTHDDGIARS